MNTLLGWIWEHKWYGLFFVWGLPLGYYRSKFRKRVYETDSWTINVKPLFLKELKALFMNAFPDDPQYIKLRNFYRIYVSIYLVLFALWLVSP